jgi:hypothetical protein
MKEREEDNRNGALNSRLLTVTCWEMSLEACATCVKAHFEHRGDPDRMDVCADF